MSLPADNKSDVTSGMHLDLHHFQKKITVTSLPAVTFECEGLGLGFGLHDDLLLLRFGDRLQPIFFGVGRFPDVRIEQKSTVLNFFFLRHR